MAAPDPAKRPAQIVVVGGGAGGLELVRTLRAQGATVPILVLSSDTSIAEVILTEGANHFLPQPFPLQALKELLRAMLPDDEAAQGVGE